LNTRDKVLHDIVLCGDSDSTDGYGSRPAKDDEAREGNDDQGEEQDEQTLLEADQHIRDAEAVAAEDEEAAAVQEQICRIRADEEEFETFNLKIIHRKNRFVLLACSHDVFIIVRQLILSSRSMPLDRPLDESPN
jgi:hypothetical protein